MAMTWLDKGPVPGPGIAKAGGTGPPADTYYYIIVPYITTEAGLTPGLIPQFYAPQYYGKRSAEQSIAVNGAEKIILTWTQVAGCDGYIIFRTTTSGDYNYTDRDRMWNAGDVATFDDTNQAGLTYILNIPECCHGAYHITTAYYVYQLVDDCLDVQGEDAAMRTLSSHDITDTTFHAGATFAGLAQATFFNIILSNGATLYANITSNANEAKLWFRWGQMWIVGSTLIIGGLRAATAAGSNILVYSRQCFYNYIFTEPTSTIHLTGSVIDQISMGGAASYIDQGINSNLIISAVVMANLRSFYQVSPDADTDIDGLDYFESYYQFSIKASPGTGTLTVNDFKCHEAGRVIFLRQAYTFTFRNFVYSDWRAHQAPEDVWFYAAGSHSYTGTCVMIDPVWKDPTSPIPNIIVAVTGVPHTGSLTVKFSLALKVVDVDGNAIVGADVNMYDKDGNLLFNDTTGADGTITDQDVIHTVYTCDAVGNLVATSKYPQRLYITKGGYRDINYYLVVDHKTDMTVPLVTEWAEGGEFAMEATSIVEFECEDEYEMEVIPGG